MWFMGPVMFAIRLVSRIDPDVWLWFTFHQNASQVTSCCDQISLHNSKFDFVVGKNLLKTFISNGVKRRLSVCFRCNRVYFELSTFIKSPKKHFNAEHEQSKRHMLFSSSLTLTMWSKTKQSLKHHEWWMLEITENVWILNTSYIIHYNQTLPLYQLHFLLLTTTRHTLNRSTLENIKLSPTSSSLLFFFHTVKYFALSLCHNTAHAS